ncbi:MAG: drug/metabolite transporter (DMT)-like permease, partial [Halioglobus sp.]
MNKDNNLRGILFMIASMVAFSVADTLVKLSTSSISPAQVLFFLLGGGLIIFALMAKLQGDKLNDPRAFLPILLLRYFTEIAGMVGMVM